jgi:hypothetical protein
MTSSSFHANHDHPFTADDIKAWWLCLFDTYLYDSPAAWMPFLRPHLVTILPTASHSLGTSLVLFFFLRRHGYLIYVHDGPRRWPRLIFFHFSFLQVWTRVLHTQFHIIFAAQENSFDHFFLSEASARYIAVASWPRDVDCISIRPPPLHLIFSRLCFSGISEQVHHLFSHQHITSHIITHGLE